MVILMLYLVLLLFTCEFVQFEVAEILETVIRAFCYVYSILILYFLHECFRLERLSCQQSPINFSDV